MSDYVELNKKSLHGRFIQIAVGADDQIYALDMFGQVWLYTYAKLNGEKDAWMMLATRRVTKDKL